jgi:hypothetical protein
MQQVTLSWTVLKFYYEVKYIVVAICGLVVRVLGHRSGGPGSIPGTTRFSGKKKKT